MVSPEAAIFAVCAIIIVATPVVVLVRGLIRTPKSEPVAEFASGRTPSSDRERAWLAYWCWATPRAAIASYLRYRGTEPGLALAVYEEIKHYPATTEGWDVYEYIEHFLARQQEN